MPTRGARRKAAKQRENNYDDEPENEDEEEANQTKENEKTETKGLPEVLLRTQVALERTSNDITMSPGSSYSYSLM